MDPLISIVTPSFQQARFLRACIDSVLTQDYPNREYCVQDGGSTDGSVAILKSYQDKLRWISRPDGGQAAAINARLMASHGEILGYLNSDDALRPDALRQVAAAFKAHPEIDVVYGNADLIDKSGQVTGRYRTLPFDPETFFGDCYLSQPATFWRRRILDKIGLFDETLQVGMDYDYWIRIILAGGGFLHLDPVLAQSRDYPETKTRSNRSGAFNEIFSISRRHLGFIHARWIESYLYYLKYETKASVRWFIPGSEIGRRPLVRLIHAFSKRCR